MTKPQGSTLVTLMILVLVFIGVKLFLPARFEYRLEDIEDSHFSDRVNTLGAQGWDMVFARRATTSDFRTESITPSSMAYEVIMRRRLLP